METVALVLGALLAIAAVLFVARPFLRNAEPLRDRLDEPGPEERRRLELEEERDRTLAALKELEFDHRTGKISEADYARLVGPLRRRAADSLRALEPPAERAREPERVTQRADPRFGAAPRGEGSAVTVPAAVQPPAPPEPAPEPHTPPAPPNVPEPVPVPHTPPAPPNVPEPVPVPHEPPAPPNVPEPQPVPHVPPVPGEPL